MNKAFLNFFLLIGPGILPSLLFTSCNSFGKEVKIKNSSVFYKDITEADAKRVGKFLYNVGYFTDENEVSVQISKPADTLQFRFVADEKMVKPQFDDQYLSIGSGLSDSVFNKTHIIIFLADSQIKDFKRVGVAVAGRNAGNSNAASASSRDIGALIKATEQVAASLGTQMKEIKGSKIFYGKDVEIDRVNALITYLDEGQYFAAGSGHIIVLLKHNSGYVFKEAFTDQQVATKSITDALEIVATSVKQDLFNKESFSFEVCNIKFEPQLTFMPKAR